MTDQAIHNQIDAEVKSHDVVLFMKGTPISHNAAFRQRSLVFCHIWAFSLKA